MNLDSERCQDLDSLPSLHTTGDDVVKCWAGNAATSTYRSILLDSALGALIIVIEISSTENVKNVICSTVVSVRLPLGRLSSTLYSMLSANFCGCQLSGV